ncbi:hypothetical protein EVAR_22156_1 [Eumeta japonica]|uniref:Uncharacterized protein n=1 Tax=Eumeta variegata TaxID=151549 RepID=A0A4C1W140_EUMVA|nr:hypothetical protein EVAR_22156_1 [Eumeta japonica]
MEKISHSTEGQHLRDRGTLGQYYSKTPQHKNETTGCNKPANFHTVISTNSMRMERFENNHRRKRVFGIVPSGAASTLEPGSFPEVLCGGALQNLNFKS